MPLKIMLSSLRYLVLTCILVLQLMNGLAQTDSITAKIQNLVDKAWEMSIEGNDSSLLLAQNALDLSIQEQYSMGEVLARESMGLYHEMITGDIEKASEQYFQAIEICEKEDLNYLSSLFHTLGVMFHTTDNYEKARQYYLKSLEQATTEKDSALIKKCLINLGSVHSSLKEFYKAEQYMKQSLDLRIETEMDYATYANLGYLYVKSEQFDKAIRMLIKATEQNPDNPNADLNLYFLLHAKTMARDSSNMTEVLSRAKKAIENDRYGLRDQSLLLRNMADYLSFTGNYKEALAYRDRYIQVFEEIKEKQRDQVVLDLERKYETEKKDAQLNLLRLESEKKDVQLRLYLFIALSGLIIALLVGFFLHKNREKNKLLTRQKKQLEENVAEIKLLLREIHHRVKNNLQVITSLLNIQQRTITDKKALEVIQESKNRIQSMGLIHQSFYQNSNLAEISSKEYINKLVGQLIENYNTKQQHIKLETSIEDVHLDIDTLVPLGLIINEMISNSLKYAFDSKSKGKISISMLRKEDTIQLNIADSGRGIENITDFKNEKSFGFSMIQAFVKKINGTLQLLKTKGTTLQIEFPL